MTQWQKGEHDKTSWISEAGQREPQEIRKNSRKETLTDLSCQSRLKIRWTFLPQHWRNLFFSIRQVSHLQIKRHSWIPVQILLGVLGLQSACQNLVKSLSKESWVSPYMLATWLPWSSYMTCFRLRSTRDLLVVGMLYVATSETHFDHNTWSLFSAFPAFLV